MARTVRGDGAGRRRACLGRKAMGRAAACLTGLQAESRLTRSTLT